MPAAALPASTASLASWPVGRKGIFQFGSRESARGIEFAPIQSVIRMQKFETWLSHPVRNAPQLWRLCRMRQLSLCREPRLC